MKIIPLKAGTSDEGGKIAMQTQIPVTQIQVRIGKISGRSCQIV